jgi:glycerophosphoryl diester phosphodiesterase
MTIVVAHAGASGHAPANTLGAFRRAAASYDGIWLEFDTQFASDELVVIHDETLDRTTDHKGSVADFTAEELKKVNAGKETFEPVITTRELLTEAAANGWRLVAELKNIPGQRSFDPSGERYADAFLALVEMTGLPIDRLKVICFWAPTLTAIKERNDEIATGYLTSPPITAATTLAMCREHGFDFISVNHRTPDLTPELVREAHEEGVDVHVWTADDPDDIRLAFGKGVDAITSNFPERVIRVVAP